MKICPSCGDPLEDMAEVCPHCDHWQPRRGSVAAARHMQWMVGAVLALGLVVALVAANWIN
jgi:hypothetical protein